MKRSEQMAYRIFRLELVLLILCSCRALEAEKDPGLKAVPDKDYDILDKGEPAVLKFSEDVEYSSVEELARIIWGDSSLELLFKWEDRRLELHPAEPVYPGRQYRLELDGIYRNKDGREREVSLSRPFYWESRDYDILTITKSNPADDGIIGRNDELLITFSSLPDPASLSQNMSISPHTDLLKTWIGNTLILSPPEGWIDLTAYRLELDGELRDEAGRPLLDSWELGFYVEDQTAAPRVMRFAACSGKREDGFPWTQPLSLSPLWGQGIRLNFSQSMNRDETEEAFSLTPSVAGELCWTGSPDNAGSPGDLAFIPEEGFEMGIEYMLKLATSACSESSVMMEDDFSVSFTADIPVLRLDTLECISTDGFVLTDYDNSTPVDLPVKIPSPYDLLFRFSFSEPFPSVTEKQGVQEGISFYEIFSGGGSPRPGLFAWESDTTLTALYSGFYADSVSEYYHVLELKGGNGGISNENGGHLEEDISQLFRVPKQ